MASLKKTASLQELILGILIMFALLFIFMTRFYSPKAKVLEDLKKDMKSLEVDKKSLKVQTDELRQQRQKKTQVIPVDSNNLKIQILKGGRVPDFSKMTTLLAKIASPSFQKELQLTELTTLGTSEANGYTKNPLRIKAKGTFSELANFLERLDSLPGLVSVDSIFFAVGIIPVETALLGIDRGADILELEIAATLYQVVGIDAVEEESEQ